MNLRHLTIIFFATLLLSSCAETTRHEILGTTYGWDNDTGEYSILLDAKIDKLRIRHVRWTSPESNCVSGFEDHLEIEGTIGPDSTAAVERLLPQLDKCIDSKGQWFVNQVFLSSGGGLLADGYAMGRLFKKYQIGTIVTGGQQCSSSCAIAFLGGKFRSMAFDAELLFHAPYLSSGIAIDCSDYGQVDELKKYYQANLGYKDGEYLLDRTMSYCSNSSGWTLNADGAKLFGITTD
tara:strand:+ start:180 stop:887 length:708 start_codon:yes stop_codon:yes gene_type:complete